MIPLVGQPSSGQTSEWGGAAYELASMIDTSTLHYHQTIYDTSSSSSLKREMQNLIWSLRPRPRFPIATMAGKTTLGSTFKAEFANLGSKCIGWSPTTPVVVEESGDLIYHLLVLWAEQEVVPEDVWAELESRFGTSGLEEKNARLKE